MKEVEEIPQDLHSGFQSTYAGQNVPLRIVTV